MTQHAMTAVVAGGSAGVGRAVVAALLDKGYAVGVLARGADRLERIAAEFAGRVRTVPCDVGDAAAVERAADEIAAALGPVGVWVNNAMLTAFSPFREMEVAEFDAILRTTFTGQVNGTRAALRLMQGAAQGRIVNVGSGLAYRSVPLQSAYCAAKHAINGFTSAVRSELLREKSGVTLSLVQLPAINTPQFDWARNRMKNRPQPAPPIFQPEVAARAVMRAVETGPRELLVGRSVLQLVAAGMLLPDWMDRKLARDGVGVQQSDIPEPGGRPDNIEAAVAHSPTARGNFGAKAADKALIVDGDLARKLAFIGAPAFAFLAGLALG